MHTTTQGLDIGEGAEDGGGRWLNAGTMRVLGLLRGHFMSFHSMLNSFFRTDARAIILI